MAFSPTELQKLAAILGMLGSDQTGERAAAALLASQFVRDRDTSWTELLHAEPPLPVVVQTPATPRYWKHTAEEALFEHSQAVTEWETGFLQDILRRGYALSTKQEATLRRIAAKTGVPTW